MVSYIHLSHKWLPVGYLKCLETNKRCLLVASGFTPWDKLFGLNEYKVNALRWVIWTKWVSGIIYLTHLDFYTHNTFQVYRDVILNVFSGAGKEQLFTAPHYRQFYATKIFNETLPAHSGEFHPLSLEAWGDREQCLSIVCLATCWHLILKRRGGHRCFFCGEPDVKRRPQGWKNEKNANESKGARTNDALSDSANNCIFPTPFRVLVSIGWE